MPAFAPEVVRAAAHPEKAAAPWGAAGGGEEASNGLHCSATKQAREALVDVLLALGRLDGLTDALADDVAALASDFALLAKELRHADLD